MIRYLLDSDIFIRAKNAEYMFEFCPAFWDWLIIQNKAGKVASIDEVGEELLKGNDALSQWAGQRGPEFFRPSEKDDAVQNVLQRVSDWAGQNYESDARDEFLECADYWLVAYALAHGFTIVTHEVPLESPLKIKIPNACSALGVRKASPYEMLHSEGARFVLDDTM